MWYVFLRFYFINKSVFLEACNKYQIPSTKYQKYQTPSTKYQIPNMNYLPPTGHLICGLPIPRSVSPNQRPSGSASKQNSGTCKMSKNLLGFWVNLCLLNLDEDGRWSCNMYLQWKLNHHVWDDCGVCIYVRAWMRKMSNLLNHLWFAILNMFVCLNLKI